MVSIDRLDPALPLIINVHFQLIRGKRAKWVVEMMEILGRRGGDEREGREFVESMVNRRK